MHLKKLELYGFKSFVDKTELLFERGNTAIVGPNGCGKTNVSDAMRWVLGEQSAKSLRGGKMEDIIFNGTDYRKALSLAEVHLTLSSVKGRLPVDAEDVTVGRRLYRSGESEYLMNGKVCRLKDIEDLFLDTGIGTNAYSVLEQGKMDQILQARPEDRREIFEEAAGISKYKVRKEEALRKLDATEQNLLRISDIIQEIKRQIGSLERQAKKAERYQALQQELRALELSTAAADARRLSHLLSTGEERRRALRQQLSGREDALREVEAARAGLAARLQDTDGRLRKQRHELQASERELHQLDSQTAAAQARLATLEEYRLQERTQMGEWEARAARLKDRHAAQQADSQRLAAELQQTRERLQLLEQDVEQLTPQVEEATLTQLRADLIRLLDTLTGRREELAKLQFTQREHQQQLEGLSKESEKVALSEASLGELQNIFAALHRHLEDAGPTLALPLREALAPLVARGRELVDRLHAASSSIWKTQEHQLGAAHAEVRTALDGVEADLAGMQEVVASLEGQRQALEDAIGTTERRMNELIALKSAKQEALHAERLTAAGVEQASRHGQEALERLAQESQDAHEDLQRRRHDLGLRHHQQEALTKELAGQAEIRASLEARHQELAAASDALEAEVDRLRTELEALQAKTQSTHHETSDLERQLHQAELDGTAHQHELKALEDRLRETYQVDLSALPSAEAAPPEGNLHEAIADLRRKLQEMGPVNLVAMEEYRELSQRYEFLSTQEQDLRNAKDSLLKTIATINTTTRTLFAQAFETIRGHFRETFRRLFQGGDADLVLLDQEHLLESGIEILARPPGKRLQSISLLSGGEKALTAIALLFALFKLKASPFCILDEIDAPLDDANVRRFNTMLQEFAKDTQFIVITHSKISMEHADVLYGVTMEEPGVSKILSVKFKKEPSAPSAPVPASPTP